jgi:hypothetical protein
MSWHEKHTLLAIDPGAKTGWALFARVDGWRLQAAGIASPNDRTWPGLKKIDQIVIEAPIRPNPHTPRPADILTLSRTIGMYLERFHENAIELVDPHTWKGSVPKEIFTRRIEAALSPADRETCARLKFTYAASTVHNMLDAIGLGYWAQKQPFMRAPRLLK